MRKKMLATILGVSMLIATAGVSPAFAGSKGDQLDGKINGLHKKQNEKEQESQNKKDKLHHVKSKKKDAMAEVKKLSTQIDDASDKIDSKQSDVTDTKQDIDKLKHKIKKTKQRIQKRDKVLQKRVRNMYENGGSVNYAEVILGSENFSDFLDRVMALNLITKQDKKLLEEQKADKQSLEKDKGKVEDKLSSLQDRLAELKDLKAGIAQKKKDKQALTDKLKAKEGKIHEDVNQQEKAMEVIQGQISDANQKKEEIKKQEEARKKEAARKRAAAKEEREAQKRKQEQQKAKAQEKSTKSSSHESHESKSQPKSDEGSKDKPTIQTNTFSENPDGGNLSGGSGKFIVPIAGANVSSGYGPRTLGGNPDFHDGIDYSASTGTPILAAGSGTVKFAGPASGFGNWIVIDHGGGLYTIYGHMYDDGIKVSQGDHVSQGQTIGAVGSNGQSTGSHLHFGVAKGGLSNRVNPNSFF